MSGGSQPVMPLGDHLDELRGRLIRVIIVLVLAVLVGLVFQARLKGLVALPMRQAVAMTDPVTLELIGIDPDPARFRLVVLSLIESPIETFKIALLFAVVISFPWLLFQTWGFVAPALDPRERRAALMTLPAAVLFFYLGIALGYLYGLPWFFRWLIEFTAMDHGIRFELRQSFYHSTFITMTLCFGLVMDLPWLVLALVRAGVVTPATLARRRRLAWMVAIVLAAVLTPPDPISQLMMFLLMVTLWESGILAARLLHRSPVADPAPEEV